MRAAYKTDLPALHWPWPPRLRYQRRGHLSRRCPDIGDFVRSVATDLIDNVRTAKLSKPAHSYVFCWEAMRLASLTPTVPVFDVASHLSLTGIALTSRSSDLRSMQREPRDLLGSKGHRECADLLLRECVCGDSVTDALMKNGVARNGVCFGHDPPTLA